jgi:hypothetical protein
VGSSKSAIGLRETIRRRLSHRNSGAYRLRASFIRDALRPAFRIRPKIRSVVASSTSRSRRRPISGENHLPWTLR